jgi:hypothetical protein
VSAKGEVETLIAGKQIEKMIHEDMTYDEMEESSGNLWTFLFFTGYLTKAREKRDKAGNLYVRLKIPNKEVAYIFNRKVREWFEEQVRARDLSELYSAIVNGDTQSIGCNISSVLGDTISFYDYHESFYHGVFLGVLSGMAGYIVKSNRESGRGRSDIVVRSPSVLNGDVYIFELKTVKNAAGLERGCDDALDQIDAKHYDREYANEGYKKIVKYGVAFYKKDCMVKKRA